MAKTNGVLSMKLKTGWANMAVAKIPPGKVYKMARMKQDIGCCREKPCQFPPKVFLKASDIMMQWGIHKAGNTGKSRTASWNLTNNSLFKTDIFSSCRPLPEFHVDRKTECWTSTCLNGKIVGSRNVHTHAIAPEQNNNEAAYIECLDGRPSWRLLSLLCLVRFYVVSPL